MGNATRQTYLSLLKRTVSMGHQIGKSTLITEAVYDKDLLQFIYSGWKSRIIDELFFEAYLAR